MKQLLFTALILRYCILASCSAQDKVATYENPLQPQISAADPAVLYHQGTFYLYSTNRDNVVYTSSDLVNWKKGPVVIPPDLKNIWAPEVYFHPEDGRFYMYYTSRYKIGVAVADRPDAMFEDLGFLAIPAIDAHPFRDDDGRLYLYFTHTPPFTMYCVPMKSPTEPGGPVTKCFEISQDWEKLGFPVNEGPTMVKHDGRYSLLYSGASGQTIHYAIGVATAPSPLGPFTKFAGNPVFQDAGVINGPGHGCIVRDRAGELWHMYHQKVDATYGWPRFICLDPMAFESDGILRGKPTLGVKHAAPVMDPSIAWTPEIQPRGAVFHEPVKVTLTSLTPDAVIHYTTDGSQPNDQSPIYSAPFSLARSGVVMARASSKGLTTSAVSREQFTYTESAVPLSSASQAISGDFPFDVFPQPTLDWRQKVVKEINTKSLKSAKP